MSWVKLDDGFSEHPKVLAVSGDALKLHLAGFCYCARQETDGAIPELALAQLTQFSKPKAIKLAARLVEVRLWERNGAGWLVHDYLDYNPSKKELDARREIKRRAGQAGGLAKQAGRERELADD